jgi:hypothetical protein
VKSYFEVSPTLRMEFYSSRVHIFYVKADSILGTILLHAQFSIQLVSYHEVKLLHFMMYLHCFDHE